MTFYSRLLADFYLVFYILGVGFYLRLGMYGFDCLLEFLSAHFQKKEP